MHITYLAQEIQSLILIIIIIVFIITFEVGRGKK